MRWIEVCVDTPANEIEKRCSAMEEMGAESFAIENEEDFKNFLDNNHQYWDYVDAELENKFAGVSRIKCYLSDDDAGRSTLDRIKAAYGEVTVNYVDDSDWENSWKDSYKPIEVGEKLVVIPEWEERPANGRLPLILEPGLTFGTGSHPTTKMVLRAMERFTGNGKRVLDLGCGSGILGIGAIVLGCASCVGVDIDTKSPDMAQYNASLNGIDKDRFTVCAGDIISDLSLRRSLGGDYDIVLANIVSDVIISLSGFARSFMKPGGVFICSGIIDDRAAEVEAVLRRSGFCVVEHLNEEEWHCYVCK